MEASQALLLVLAVLVTPRRAALLRRRGEQPDARPPGYGYLPGYDDLMPRATPPSLPGGPVSAGAAAMPRGGDPWLPGRGVGPGQWSQAAPPPPPFAGAPQGGSPEIVGEGGPPEPAAPNTNWWQAGGGAGGPTLSSADYGYRYGHRQCSSMERFLVEPIERTDLRMLGRQSVHETVMPEPMPPECRAHPLWDAARGPHHLAAQGCFEAWGLPPEVATCYTAEFVQQVRDCKQACSQDGAVAMCPECGAIGVQEKFSCIGKLVGVSSECMGCRAQARQVFFMECSRPCGAAAATSGASAAPGGAEADGRCRQCQERALDMHESCFDGGRREARNERRRQVRRAAKRTIKAKPPALHYR